MSFGITSRCKDLDVSIHPDLVLNQSAQAKKDAPSSNGLARPKRHLHRPVFIRGNLDSGITSRELAAKAEIHLTETTRVYATAMLRFITENGSVYLVGGKESEKKLDVAIRVDPSLSSLPFKTAVINSIKAKMYYDKLGKRAKNYIDISFASERWVAGACVQTTQHAVILTTAITVVCDYKLVDEIERSLKLTMWVKEDYENVPRKNLTDFSIVTSTSPLLETSDKNPHITRNQLVALNILRDNGFGPIFLHPAEYMDWDD
jgi:hypothetical protein